MKKRAVYSFLIACLAGGSLSAAAATRIKDIASIQGVRENQLYGYGLVVGLNGTGDRQSSFPTLQTVGNMLRKMGVHVSPSDVSSKVRTRNIAAVMVTAKLPPLIRPGAKIDVLVSSLGDASSLDGGVLMQTPLQGADGRVYAVAQGSLSTGLGLSGSSRRGAPLTVARIPEGALVEQEVPSTIVQGDYLSIVLKHPDFTTAARIIENINDTFSAPLASASDAGIIQVLIPEETADNLVGFIASLETISVEPDFKAKVVVNERTGTIVAGKDVKISTVAVSHGNISVQISGSREKSFSQGQSRRSSGGESFEESISEAISGEGTLKVEIMEESVSVYDLVKALNALGIAPKDLIAILQAIKEAGALHSELELI